jgi:hypothetical protein
MASSPPETPDIIDAQPQISALYPNYPKPEQVQEFYAAMGQAIAAWQLVESNLYEVYRASTGARCPGARCPAAAASIA